MSRSRVFDYSEKIPRPPEKEYTKFENCRHYINLHQDKRSLEWSKTIFCIRLDQDVSKKYCELCFHFSPKTQCGL